MYYYFIIFFYKPPSYFILIHFSSQVGLLDDHSGDEDDFAALSRDRVNSKNGDSKQSAQNRNFTSQVDFFAGEQDTCDANFFDTDFGESANPKNGYGDGSNSSKNLTDGVDLLNIGSASTSGSMQPDVVTNQLNNLSFANDTISTSTNKHISDNRNNIDLLGTVQDSGRQQPDLMGGIEDDSFDPFLQFSAPVTSSTSAPTPGTFDPFQNLQMGSGMKVQNIQMEERLVDWKRVIQIWKQKN